MMKSNIIGECKELDSVVGRQETNTKPQPSIFFDRPYSVIKLHKDIIAVLAPEPYLYFSGTEKMGLCKACGSKLIKFYRKLVCSNCGNQYSAKNVEFPINKNTRREITRVARILADKERNWRRAELRALLERRKYE